MQDRDFKKAASQHLEMDVFFSGGMTLKGNKTSQPPAENDHPADSKSKGDEMDKAAMLEKIADEVKKCRKCVLAETRTNVVPGEGDANTRLVFVGEGPGADEDTQGRPFVGRAGQLLDKIISAMQLQRSQVYICNIIKCRPPGNRDPKPEEINSCLPYLKRQLAAIGPDVIVALGAHAARTLLQCNDAIGKLRGKFHEFHTSEDSEPIKLMPTYHPSYLLRNYSPDNRKRVWEDMQKVMAELGIEVKKS